MKAIIIEDETLAAERLEKLLKEVAPEIAVEAKLGSIKESVKWLSKNKVDLIFLDIQLSDGLSFSIFNQINVNIPIIFTTAFDQYAVKAFQLNSVSYLLKPIRKSELAESLQKYKSLKTAYNIDFKELLDTMGVQTNAYKKRFLIQIADKFKKIEIEEVSYFCACDKSVFMRTQDGASYGIDQSLDALESQLDPELFFRINRGYIISLKSIHQMISWSRSRVKLILNPEPEGKEEVVVSIDRSGDFKKWLNN